eukprot:gnl/TRDRNA2_/TRDRNA2_204064_c0_seq1.p2 gnl/TRDRNA2_/TRDRNA2_204064_c0~~gnl/TRDRNA2_/TRDRNA2_204064_c0_seq1.p2  ORF type:complete len:105 (+),score=0.57 gnl/TRDRNA2_/TRDRNA2_204064_c0_seq1:53-367(+)
MTETMHCLQLPGSATISDISFARCLHTIDRSLTGSGTLHGVCLFRWLRAGDDIFDLVCDHRICFFYGCMQPYILATLPACPGSVSTRFGSDIVCIDGSSELSWR